MWEKFSLTFLVVTSFFLCVCAKKMHFSCLLLLILWYFLEWWCNHLKINITFTFLLWQIHVEFLHSFDKTMRHITYHRVYDFLLQFYFYFTVYYARSHNRYRIKINETKSLRTEIWL